MTRSKFGNVSPTIEAALERYQATADRQANRWIEREIVGLMRGRPAFYGNQPRVTYTRHDNVATISHGAA